MSKVLNFFFLKCFLMVLLPLNCFLIKIFFYLSRLTKRDTQSLNKATQLRATDELKREEKFRLASNIAPRDKFRSRSHDNRMSRKTPYDCQDQSKNTFCSFARPNGSMLFDKNKPLLSTLQMMETDEIRM